MEPISGSFFNHQQSMVSSIKSNDPWCKVNVVGISLIRSIVIRPPTRCQLLGQTLVIQAEWQPISTPVHLSLSLSRIGQWCLQISRMHDQNKYARHDFPSAASPAQKKYGIRPSPNPIKLSIPAEMCVAEDVAGRRSPMNAVDSSQPILKEIRSYDLGKIRIEEHPLLWAKILSTTESYDHQCNLVACKSLMSKKGPPRDIVRESYNLEGIFLDFTD